MFHVAKAIANLLNITLLKTRIDLCYGIFYKGGEYGKNHSVKLKKNQERM
ncbi:MAG: hypothetical protein WBA93_13370 [Microcoleaceae cyanobacterium]